MVFGVVRPFLRVLSTGYGAIKRLRRLPVFPGGGFLRLPEPAFLLQRRRVFKAAQRQQESAGGVPVAALHIGRGFREIAAPQPFLAPGIVGKSPGNAPGTGKIVRGESRFNARFPRFRNGADDVRRDDERERKAQRDRNGEQNKRPASGTISFLFHAAHPLSNAAAKSLSNNRSSRS